MTSKASSHQGIEASRRVVLVMLALAGLTSCRSGSGDRETTSPTAITRTASDGPVSIRYTVAPTDLAVSGRATATIEITTGPGVTVPAPDFARRLSEGDRAFECVIIRTEQTAAKPADNGNVRSTYRYEIEFVLAGEYDLPPVEIAYADVAPADGANQATATPQTHRVVTEGITVHVRPSAAVASGPEELQNIRRLDPVELAGVWDRWWWTAPLFAAGAIALVMMFVRRTRRQRAEVVVVIPAHEWARQQLAALLACDLIGRSMMHEFYYRISAIVRGYIERRFDVSAPEMTTEEFLAVTAEDRRFGADVRHELGRFMEACDLVKYARYQPGREEADAALRAAGEFVERTRARPEMQPVPTAPDSTVGEPVA